MKNLIVNADDLGWTEGVNRGIAEAHRNGIVTSASVLANGVAFDSAVKLAKSIPNLGIGVHLNLSDGRPVAERAEVASLLNEAGEFQGGPEKLLVLKLIGLTLAPDEVEREWDAQIGKVRHAGISPTHVDGHKHVHMLPGMFEIALRVAKKHGIGAIRVSLETPALRDTLSGRRDGWGRTAWKQGAQAQGLRVLARNARRQAEEAGIATADHFCGIVQTGALTKESVMKFLRSLPEGTTELMCHPGYADEELKKTATRLQQSRGEEVSILTDTAVRKLVASQGIRLIDYGFVSSKA